MIRAGLAAVCVAGAAQAQTVPPRLGGTMIAGTDRVAIFAEPPGAVGEGETVAGFVVRRIGPGVVELEGPQGRVRVTPAGLPARDERVAMQVERVAVSDK